MLDEPTRQGFFRHFSHRDLQHGSYSFLRRGDDRETFAEQKSAHRRPGDALISIEKRMVERNMIAISAAIMAG